MNKYQEALDFIIDHTHPMCETMKDLEALDFSYNILQELVDKETPMKPNNQTPTRTGERECH